MIDTFSKTKRSEIMQAVKSKGNQSTEIKLIQIFKSHQITGWRRNYKIVGRPDFVFPKRQIALFADGCFWHGHHCRNLTPANNAEYWKKKIQRNKARDRAITRELNAQGWLTVRIWECEIKKGAVKKLKKAGLLKERRFCAILRRDNKTIKN
jgi:DNA mismatch endonuclease (patch repair protein)